MGATTRRKILPKHRVGLCDLSGPLLSRIATLSASGDQQQPVLDHKGDTKLLSSRQLGKLLLVSKSVKARVLEDLPGYEFKPHRVSTFKHLASAPAALKQVVALDLSSLWLRSRNTAVQLQTLNDALLGCSSEEGDASPGLLSQLNSSTVRSLRLIQDQAAWAWTHAATRVTWVPDANKLTPQLVRFQHLHMLEVVVHQDDLGALQAWQEGLPELCCLTLHVAGFEEDMTEQLAVVASLTQLESLQLKVLLPNEGSLEQSRAYVVTNLWSAESQEVASDLQDAIFDDTEGMPEQGYSWTMDVLDDRMMARCTEAAAGCDASATQDALTAAQGLHMTRMAAMSVYAFLRMRGPYQVHDYLVDMKSAGTRYRPMTLSELFTENFKAGQAAWTRWSLCMGQLRYIESAARTVGVEIPLSLQQNMERLEAMLSRERLGPENGWLNLRGMKGLRHLTLDNVMLSVLPPNLVTLDQGPCLCSGPAPATLRSVKVRPASKGYDLDEWVPTGLEHFQLEALDGCHVYVVFPHLPKHLSGEHTGDLDTADVTKHVCAPLPLYNSLKTLDLAAHGRLRVQHYEDSTSGHLKEPLSHLPLFTRLHSISFRARVDLFRARLRMRELRVMGWRDIHGPRTEDEARWHTCVRLLCSPPQADA